MNMAGAPRSAAGALAAQKLPQDCVFALTADGRRELHGRITDLPLSALELLVRLDGTTPLAEVRGAMARLDEDTFRTAFRVLLQRKLIAEAEPTPFDPLSTQQLRMLASAGIPTNAAAGDTSGSFAVSLVRRRAARPHGPGMPRAVVVEDEPTLARFIECFLALEGFEVTLAANRAEVVAALNTRPLPALILLDGTLPDADGFDVLARVRQHPALRDVPTLMLTGRATRAAVLQALAAGADGYLTKPVEADTLTQAVRAVTGINDTPGLSLKPAGAWSNPDALERRAG
jgi:CheY-like chemotaxis protein